MVQAPQEIVTVGQQIPVAIDAVHCGRPETVAFLLQGPGHFDAMRQVYHATAPGIAKVTVVSGESGQHATLRFDVIQPSVATLEVEIVPTAPRVDAAPAMHVPALTVLFDFESAAVTAAGREALQQLVPALQAAADMPIVITGHTDATGPTAFNAELAMRRAEAVARVLEAAQISVARMRLEGFGESRPVAPNTTREGRAANRRVEVRPGH
jgi:outer membrane protein OmpA-like peptidoglycan-associated protein